MKKIIFLILFLTIALVNAGPNDGEGTADPDTISTPINIVKIFDAPAKYPEGVAFDGKYVWTTSIIEGRIFKHNPDTGEIISTFLAPGIGPMDLAWDGANLWNADYDNDKIYKLDASGNVLKEFDTPGELPMGLTWDGNYLWHSDYGERKIYKMDIDGNIILSFDSPGIKPQGLAWDEGYLWTNDAITYNIFKLDSTGNIIEKYSFPHSYPTGLAVQGDFLWMCARDTTKIYKLKVPETKELIGLNDGLANSPWPKFRGNLQNTGQSPYDTSHIDGTVKWIYETNDEFESSPSIGIDGTIYIGSHSNNLYALNSDGTLKWKFSGGDPVLVTTPGHSFGYTKGMMSSPAIAQDGTIYIRSMSHYLFAVNPDGTEKWRHPVDVNENTWSSPSIGTDGTVYVAGAALEYEEEIQDTSGKLYAINPDGTLKWRFLAQNDVFPSPAIDKDGIIYFGSGWGDFYAVKPDGNLKWKFRTGKHIESSAVIGSDGTIYVGSWDHNLYALNPDGTEKWHFEKIGEGIVATPALSKDGTIYHIPNDGYIYALDQDGKEKWKFRISEDVKELTASPAIGAEGTIYIGGSFPRGEPSFFAINPDGTLKWSYPIGGTGPSPAIGNDGTVYVAAFNNRIYAFGGPGEGQEVVIKKEESEPIEKLAIEKNMQAPITNKTESSEWNPKEEGVDCFQPESAEIKEKCNMFCYDNPNMCPGYFEREEKREEPKKEMGFFQKIFYWLSGLFR